ncbi:uncharacterized protein LOC131036010 isoform X1 [Cryptomeria japonica]|uniref:uncharacterized protein LOC131036010 isoform X1 n=1 Tax=Cryptomeria japonica TaxID=3369 RepID=UPI0027DAAC8F|nr:uncharacterized protein LOC131036010 isoform X1 [Cryptomeria japonica]
MEGLMAAQVGRKEWRMVAEGSVGRGENHNNSSNRAFVEGINDSSSRRGAIRPSRSNSNSGSVSSSMNHNNNSSCNGVFHSGGSSEHSSDSGESGPANLMVGNMASPRQNISPPEDATIYEIKHVQQANIQLDNDLGSISIESGLSNNEDSMQQGLHEIVRQREQLQRMEIDLRARFIAQADVFRIQTEFEEQTKQHASIVASLQEQLEQRDHHMRDLEQQLEERQRQLHVNQIEINEAVWAKDGLLREQNNELATLRRECETALSEQKATAAQLESERTQHLTELQDLKEQLHEKEREIHEIEEQRRSAQEMLLYKDDQLRETQTWLARLQEMDAIHVNNSHNLQVELRDRVDQFNQFWLSCQRQLADQERYYVQTIQHLQIELAEAREQSQISKDNLSLNQSESKEKKQSHSENKGGNQYNVNGDASSKTSKNGSTLVLNNQAKAGMIPNGNVDGATPLILVRDLPAKVEHAAGLPVSPSPVFGMATVLPSDPMGMMHPFGVHQQSIPQTLQPAAAQVPPPPFGQFQSISAVVPRQEVPNLQHQQQIHQTHNYIHQNQPPQVQRFPPRQQSHSNHQVNMKSQALHSKHQDMHTNSHHEQTGGDMVDMQKEQQAQKPKEENQEQKLSSIIQQEYNEHHHQPQETSLDQACQQDPQAISIHSSFQPLEQSRRLEQQQLPSFLQHQIKQSKADLGNQDMEYETQHVTHSHDKSMNAEQLGPISRAPVSASPSSSFGGSSHFHQNASDCKPHSETSDVQSSPVQSPQKSFALDGYGKVSDPALLDETSLLGCFVRAIPAEASARIKISTTLPNRLGKMLAPLHWHDYKKQYGRLDEFVASHSELFIIEGDFIHLREGAHATFSATTAVAKVAAAAAAAASPFGTARMPTIAVTPVAQSQVHRLRKGIFINSKDVKVSSLDPSPMVQIVSNSSNQYTHLHGGMLKQSQSSASRTSVVNGNIGQNPDVNHGATENLPANSKEDVTKAEGLSINTRLDGLAINSNAASVGNFDKAVTNGYKNTGASNGRIGMHIGRQGRFPGSASYIKQEFVNRPQTQESRITRIDPSTAPVR